jgi:ribonuclease HI
MLGKGLQWEATNWMQFKMGDRVRNRNLVMSIMECLKTPNAELKKVVGHSNNQWNDTVDALAVKGRNEAAD